MSLSLKPVAALLGTALVATAYGFKKPVHFIGTGYGLSMAAMAAVTGFMCRKTASATSTVHAVGVFLYGARLATFLLRRRSTPTYQPNAKTSDTRMSTLPTSGRAGFWLSVSALYACMFTPVYCTMRAGGALRSAQVALPLMFAGLALEAVADEQKQAAKKAKPDSFVSTGVFKLCRHPNYLGEILMWSGSWLAGLSAYQCASQWAASCLGLAGILSTMSGAARRLGAKQDARYAGRPEWEEYRRSTRPLLPLPRRKAKAPAALPAAPHGVQ